MAPLGRFFRQSLVMMIGTAGAQAIPLLVAPLLTRLYSPDQFGVLSAVIAASAIAALIGTLRFELAIPLPSSQTEAAAVALVAMASALLCSLLLLLVSQLGPGGLSMLWKGSHPLWHVVAALMFAIATNQIFNYIAIRQGQFRWVASSLFIQQVLAAAIAVAAALAGLTDAGLIAGRVAGQAGAAILLFVGVLPWLRINVADVSRDVVPHVVRKYRQFPLFNVPYSLLGTFSREFLVLTFAALGQTAAAGQLGLARAVLTAPISFLSSSLSQVFYREAATSLGTPAFRQLTLTLFVTVGFALGPFFVLVWLWAPEAFELIFGAHWRGAGDYASILMPIVFLSLFTSWPERVFEVSNKQHYSLMIQLVFDTLSVGATFFALWKGASPQLALTVYVSIQVGYQLTYLAAVFHLSSLGFRLYGGFVALLTILVALLAAILEPFAHGAAPTLVNLIALASLATVLGGAGGASAYVLSKRFRAGSEPSPSA